MNKKIAFGPKSPALTKPNSDEWVQTRSLPSAEEDEVMKRFTIDVPEALHRRIKATCAMRGVKMADEIRRLLEEHFPKAKDQAA